MTSKKKDDQPIIRQRPLTYDDYAALDDDLRYELVDGVLELMSPAPAVAHQVISIQILKRIADICEHGRYELTEDFAGEEPVSSNRIPCVSFTMAEIISLKDLPIP